MNSPGDSRQNTVPCPLWPAMLVAGFGTAAAMWLVGFITHLPFVAAPAPVVGVLLLLLQVGAAVLVGRVSSRRIAVKTGVGTGVVAALVNLLVLGSFLADPQQTNSLKANALVLAAGYLGFACVVGGLGGLVGSRTRGQDVPDAEPADWLARMGVVALCAIIPVIFSGGIVTTTGSGLAVPDWPTSYASNMFLFPLSRMTGGVYYEHAHRLFGSLAGLSAIVLLGMTLKFEHRAWVKGFVLALLVLICLQGLLGGLRVNAATPSADVNPGAGTVDNALSVPLAMLHGIAGQLTIALFAVAAGVLSRRWRTQEPRADLVDSPLFTLTTALVAVMLLQLGFGAATRHFKHLHAAYGHAGFALIVAVVAALAGFRAARHRDIAALRVFGNGAAHLTWLQIALGVATLFLVLPYDQPKSTAAQVIATLHQFNGAAMLVMCFSLWAWTRRTIAG